MYSKRPLKLAPIQPQLPHSTSRTRHSTLNYLRNRRHSNDFTGNKDLGKVMKEYLIPMLEAHSKTNFAENALCTSRLSVASQSALELYPKLTDCLSRKIRHFHGEVVAKRLREERLRGEIVADRSELATLQRETIKVECHLAMLEPGFAHEQGESSDTVEKQISEFRGLMNGLNREQWSVLTEKVQETAVCTSLWQRNIILKHNNSHLSMNNNIMGERLRCLLNTVKVLSTQSHLELVLSAEISHSTGTLQLALQKFESKLYTLNILKSLNFNTFSNTTEKFEQRREILKNLQKFKNGTKEEIERLSRRIPYMKLEIEKHEFIHANISKKLEELNILYLKSKQTLREIYSNKHGDHANLEQICSHCKNVFTENRNYNWSCAMHPSEWSGTIFWCCGKMAVEAPGCTNSKHMTSDEDKATGSARTKCRTSFKCPSCSQFGHKLQMCPKDPNVRSRANQSDEIERLIKLKVAKRRKSQVHSEVRANKDLYASVRKDNWYEHWDDLDFMKTERNFREFIRCSGCVATESH